MRHPLRGLARTYPSSDRRVDIFQLAGRSRSRRSASAAHLRRFCGFDSAGGKRSAAGGWADLSAAPHAAIRLEPSFGEQDNAAPNHREEAPPELVDGQNEELNWLSR